MTIIDTVMMVLTIYCGISILGLLIFTAIAAEMSEQ